MYLLRVLHQITQQSEFNAGEWQSAAIGGGGLLAVGVEGNPTPVQFIAGLALMTPANGFQPRQQLGGVKGFAEVVVGAGFQAIDALMPGIAGGQNQHRSAVAGSAPAAQHFQAVFTGQTQVKNNQVGL